jgi:hypothetical protein
MPVAGFLHPSSPGRSATSSMASAEAWRSRIYRSKRDDRIPVGARQYDWLLALLLIWFKDVPA